MRIRASPQQTEGLPWYIGSVMLVSSQRAAFVAEREEGGEVSIHDVINYMETHLREPMTLKKIAGHFSISESYFSHLFKTNTGISPMKYVLIRRIEEAQNLLTNPDLTIRNVSERIGFNDSAYFSRAFKKITGITPSEYRQRFLKARTL